ncbi:Nucleoside diphosphate kinase [Ostreococcus tauri]|uniref:Nucleoside diphosphate kinase n=1 Tax=Ostreococcus tauri TaxID=70448 RepID=A0A090M622_OSTTA|nr:Nucleoside diphosphate kinase [Ostreococcus tauri]CEF99690.1 Nucleoside diphosphate kinase [Ostreococcus tauri]|eukprot:XP_022839974.1 Nucleoside diphosphate kinase [Ostreococcus tauri]
MLAQKVERLSFRVEWYDSVQERSYELVLRAYADGDVELIDEGKKRTFLRKCEPDRMIKREDLYLGNVLTVYARRLTIKEYADDVTRIAVHERSEEACVIVENDDINRVGRVIASMQASGMTVADVRTAKFDGMRAEELETALPRRGRALALGSGFCAIKVMGRDANTVLERMFGDGVVRSTGEEHARALSELVATSSSQRVASSTNSSLVVIKPSGMAHLGEIIDVLIEKRGFDLVQVRTAMLTRAEAESFYAVYVDVLPKEDVKMMVDELSGGACVALQVTRVESPETLVDDVREIVGPRDPEVARALRPDSLRARFGVDKSQNAVHCVDLPEDGPLEVDFFFNLKRRTAIA